MSLINSAYMVGDKIKYKKRDEYFCVNNIVTIETGYIISIDARVSINKISPSWCDAKGSIKPLNVNINTFSLIINRTC